MFNFGRKKDSDKDRKRKDKKERQKKFLDGGGMTQEELSRLSELTRKSSGTSPEKLPSGITADYRLLQEDQQDFAKKSSKFGGSRPTSLNTPPPLPEKPPPKVKKSILKSSSKNSYDVTRSVSSELDDPQVLLRNTKQNEEYAYRKSLAAAAAAASAAAAFGNLTSPVKGSPISSSGSTDYQGLLDCHYRLSCHEI